MNIIIIIGVIVFISIPKTIVVISPVVILFIIEEISKLKEKYEKRKAAHSAESFLIPKIMHESEEDRELENGEERKSSTCYE
jgi:hypothetical protein